MDIRAFTKEMAELLPKVGAQSDDLSGNRTQARQCSVRVMRSLEAVVRSYLGGERLRGIPSLVSREAVGESFFAVRLRGKPGARLESGLPGQKVREVLCFSQDASLIMVSLVPSFVGDELVGSKVEFRPATDEDILAEDLEAFARLLPSLLAEHVRAAGQTSNRYARMVDFAYGLDVFLKKIPAVLRNRRASSTFS